MQYKPYYYQLFKLSLLQHMMYLLLGTVLSLVLTIYRFLAWSLVSVTKQHSSVYFCRFCFLACILHTMLGTFAIKSIKFADMPLDSVNCIHCGPC